MTHDLKIFDMQVGKSSKYSIYSCSCTFGKLHMTLWDPHELSHTRLSCPSLSPGVFSDSCPLSQWCYLTISSSDTLFSFCLQSFWVSRSFLISQLFTIGQSIGALASSSVFQMNIQSWFPLGLTGLIFLQSHRGEKFNNWILNSQWLK